MNAIIIIAIIFGSIVTLAGLVCGTVVLIIKMRKNGLSGAARKANKDEAMVIQEIYRGLEKMEHRIEALETILMDSHKKPGDKNEYI